ncbi:Gfo/Idh/MocA family protein [Halorarum salinum]|uniref:Gfo/Idh/MocA family oxidoreductase n=1 Tax=Halorarum salinum TaxID=2743089 RepID=A0A7D5QBK0_9EURY|nr:Gfo/Idh/MocA family oxidoreductase [Halobaculum salinum]QLG61860.1 Gfo/Idh/MocA family oxidoreductase [Halobaculum salinum]
MVIQLGAIGIGGIGHLELDFLAGMADVQIVAGADVSRGACAVFEDEFDAPAYADHRAMLDAHAGELDGVLVATPHVFHYEQATACLEAGLHVLLEKPMTMDVRDAVALARTARNRDRVLQIGYQRRFHPVFQTMKNVVDSGRMGDLHTVVCYIGQDWITPQQGTWRVDPEVSGGGQLYDTGSHLLDALLWVSGGAPETVTASIEYAVPEIDVSAALTTRLAREGHVATASVAVTGDGVETDPREGYVVWGTRGCLVYTGDRLYVEHKGATRYTVEAGAATHYDETTFRKVRNFVDAVAGRADPQVPAAESVPVVALTEGAYLAAEEGRTVDVQRLIADAEREFEGDGR